MEMIHTDKVFFLWTMNGIEIVEFIEQANSHHPTKIFTAEVSEMEKKTLLDTNICKGERFKKRLSS